MAGVSPITVSRALNTPDKVRPETRERVAAAVKQTGYVVNSFASTLRSGRSPVVALFVSNLRSQKHAAAAQGCADAFEKSGYYVLMAQFGPTPEARREIIESVIPLRPAAMMFTDLLRNEATRALVRGLGVPVAETWDESPDPLDVLVALPTAEVGRLMGRHFGARGFRRIAYAGKVDGRRQRRIEGFREGLAEHGRTLDLVLPIDGVSSFTEGMAALEAILGHMPDCDAVFFSSDVLANGAMLAAQKRGMRIPDDLAIAGNGDFDFARHLRPALTSIGFSGYDIGRLAGDLLLQRVRGLPVAQRVVTTPIRLELRDSTGRA
jgi:LacI family gluconate utilization system Gnt-I transcriptional repressor